MNPATIAVTSQHGTQLPAYIADLSRAARAQVQSLRARLDRTTRRERLLLGGLAVAAFLYAPVVALDWRTAQEERYTQATTDRSAARLTLASARRVAADPTSQAVLDDMNSWGFTAANIDVARVLIEQRLIEDAQAVGLGNARVSTDEEAQAIGPLQWLGAEVTADLSWTAVFGFLDRLGAWPEGFQVTGFTYRLTPASRNPNFVASPNASQTPPRPNLGQVVIDLAFPVEVDGGAEGA